MAGPGSAHKPVSIQTIGSELVIVWDDGRESYYPFELLRRHCPCAACTGEPDFFGRGVLERQKIYAANAFEMTRWERVGAYALQPSWADGHQSGIFSWTALRAICPTMSSAADG